MEEHQGTLRKTVRDVVIGIVAGVVIELTLKALNFEDLVPYVPRIWLGIFVFLALDVLIRRKEVREWSSGFYRSLNWWQRIMSYIAVASIGAATFSVYWFAMTSVFNARAVHGEHGHINNPQAARPIQQPEHATTVPVPSVMPTATAPERLHHPKPVHTPTVTWPAFMQLSRIEAIANSSTIAANAQLHFRFYYTNKGVRPLHDIWTIEQMIVDEPTKEKQAEAYARMSQIFKSEKEKVITENRNGATAGVGEEFWRDMLTIPLPQTVADDLLTGKRVFIVHIKLWWKNDAGEDGQVGYCLRMQQPKAPELKTGEIVWNDCPYKDIDANVVPKQQ